MAKFVLKQRHLDLIHTTFHNFVLQAGSSLGPRTLGTVDQGPRALGPVDQALNPGPLVLGPGPRSWALISGPRHGTKAQAKDQRTRALVPVLPYQSQGPWGSGGGCCHANPVPKGPFWRALGQFGIFIFMISKMFYKSPGPWGALGGLGVP